MRFGLALPHYDFSFPDRPRPVRFEDTARVVRLAEGLGFSSAWISDHFFLSLAKYGAGDQIHGALEPFTALAALSSMTERIRLGTMVACAPLRHPVVTAKMAVTIDALSEGRFELGLGAGWFEDEFTAFGLPFGSLGSRFDELDAQMQILDALLGADEPVSLDAGGWSLHDAMVRPAPVQQPRMPLWLGAKGGPRAMRLVARHADGWNTAWRWTPASYAERVRALDEACEGEGRDPATVRRTVGLYLLMGEDQVDLVERWRGLQAWTPGGALDGDPLEDYAKDSLTGTPERVHALIEAYADLGVEEIIVNPSSMPFAVSDIEQLQMFSEEIIGAVAA